MAVTGVLRPGHVQLRVLDLQAAVNHYTQVLGLWETGRDAQGRIYLKAWDEHDHHSIILREAGEAGMDSIGWKVDSPATLARLAADIKASGLATEMRWIEGVEGSGPQPHYHPWDESFFVLHGEVDFNVDSDTSRVATAGTLVHIPAGCTHWFRWRAGGGAMLSITSREAASRMFVDIANAAIGGPPTREEMNEICSRYGCT